MDSSLFANQKIKCGIHKKEFIAYVCTFPDCNYGCRLLCQKCVQSDAPHITHHKRSIIQIKDFLDDQQYLIEPSLAEELLNKTSDIEKKIKQQDMNFKDDDMQIDKDLTNLFTMFFRITDTARTALKNLLREPMNKLQAKIKDFMQVLNTVKTNKTEAKELAQIIQATTEANSEEIFNKLVQKRMQKNNEFNMNLVNLISELDQNIKQKPTYKKREELQKQYESIVDYFERTCLHTAGQMKNLIQLPSKKTKKADFSKLNSTPTRDKNIGQKVAKIAQDIERSKSIFSKSPSSYRGSERELGIPLKTLESFPELGNPNIIEMLGRFPEIKYPEQLQIDGVDFKKNLSSYPIFELPDMSVYQGQWREMQRHGLGRIVFIDGGIYEGTWQNDIPSGFGRIIRRNGDMYEGEIKNYQAHGRGIFTTLDGYRYEGDWEEDKKEGQGQESTENGIFFYKGGFSENKYSGEGTIKLEDGTVYECNFEDGKPNGKGTSLSYDHLGNPERYEGEFVNWKKHGKGFLVMGDGSEYIGDFEEDLPNGYGEFKWPDGSLFKGAWKNGQQHGIGEEINTNGESSRQGEWHLGRWVKWLN